MGFFPSEGAFYPPLCLQSLGFSPSLNPSFIVSSQLEMTTVNSADSQGRTALMRAIAARQHRTALFLLSIVAAPISLRITWNG